LSVVLAKDAQPIRGIPTILCKSGAEPSVQGIVDGGKQLE